MLKRFRLLTILPIICLLTVTCLAWLVVNHNSEFTDIKRTLLSYKMAAWDTPAETGTAEIEFLSPKPLQMFAPGSTVEVEASIRMKGRKIKDIYILGNGIDKKTFPGEKQELSRMQLVSNEGDVYRYHYTLENAPHGEIYNNLSIMVMDTTGAMSLHGMYYIVRKLWPINITSPREGQIFTRKGLYLFTDYNQQHQMKQIPIDWSPGVPQEYGERGDKFSVYIDGKDYTEAFNSRSYWHTPVPGTHSVEIVRSFDGVELTRSAPVTFHVK